jgi:hypothetical protein
VEVIVTSTGGSVVGTALTVPLGAARPSGSSRIVTAGQVSDFCGMRDGFAGPIQRTSEKEDPSSIRKWWESGCLRAKKKKKKKKKIIIG